MRYTMSAVAAAALGLCVSTAGAATVDFLGFTHGSESVNYSLMAPNVLKSGSASAGGFLTSLNGGPSFQTFCVDLYQTINFADPAYNNYTRVPGSAHFLQNPAGNADLGRLYAEGHALNDSVAEAAFQIAVWEITYETSGSYDLGKGSATFHGGTAGTSGALTLAAHWLGGLGSAPSAGVHVLESREHQDVIFAPVPEPETYALMMAGLMGMAFVSKRRNAKR